MYETVAPFTAENGYAMAGSYLNGEVVDSMGGGICQVSTTLYNAVLRAELEVVERSPHSMTVHYVELSEDAAIAGTYKDFKFKNSTDYPIYAKKVAHGILDGECDLGILVCGTGIGISITANKIKGIRAAVCTDCFTAEATRLHNDANILALGGRVVGPGLAVKIVDTFLNTPFSGDERHIRRIAQIETE